MYKLVAIDLDGTLLNSYGKITPKSKETLTKAIESGIDVVLTSGRPISSVKNLAEEIGAKNYIICGNGSILYDLRNDSIVFGDYLNRDRVLEICKFCDENSIFYSVYTDKVTLAKALKYNIAFYNYENIDKPDSKKTLIKLENNIYDYLKENVNQNILKITICDDSKIIFDRIIKKFKPLEDLDVLDVSHMSSKKIKYGVDEISIGFFYTEITNRDVNKWKAIEKIMEIENIKREEVVAIGDNMNDVMMIKEAGLGVLMGNANPAFREYADVVTTDNNNDGVAEAFINNIL